MLNFGAMMRAFDAVMMFRDAAKRLKGDPPPETDLTTTVATNPSLGMQLETRLTNVVVAALKEAFDRDHARLELERAQLEEQRRRAEAAQRLELRRQAVDRELSRLRLVAGIALAGWVASVALVGFRAAAMSVAARVVVAIAWLLLVGALGAAFSAQGRVSAYAPDGDQPIGADATANAALWLLVAGLAVSATSLLL